MRIHADKIEGDPPHGLCVRDIRFILASVPPSWTKGLREVRLANGLLPKGMHRLPQAFCHRSVGSLILYTRGCPKREVLAATLCALAATSLNIDVTVSCSPSDAEKRRLSQLVEPLVEEILPEMTPPKKLSPEAYVRWQPIPFPNDAA